MLHKTLLLAALASFVAAQNAFTMDGPSSIAAGTPYNITWAPSAGSVTVSLFLRQGEAKALNTVATIASSIKNTGSYVWTPPSTLPAGTNYAFEIVDGSDPNINNYSGQFAIDSTNTDAPTATSQSIHSASVVIVPTTSTSSLTVAEKETSTSSSVATSVTPLTDSTTNVKSTSSTAVTSKKETASTTTGMETSSASSKTLEGTKTGTGTATGTDSGTSSAATKNAAGAVRASGALLGLGVVGGLMAAL